MTEHKHKKYALFLVLILLLSFLLNIYAISWGLPKVWHPDNRVGTVLRMAHEKSLHPGTFENPTLHTYMLLLWLSPYFVYMQLSGNIPAATSMYSLPEQFLTTTFILARLLSAVLATATVFLVFLIGKRIYNEEVGLLSAFFLSITTALINHAHFETPSVAVTFFCTLTLLLCTYIIERNKPRFYILTGICAGFAIATKYIALFIILPALVAYFLAQRKKFKRFSWPKLIFDKRLFYLLISTAAGFALAAPFTFLDYGGFRHSISAISDWIKYELAINGHVYMHYIQALKNDFGIPLFVIIISGILFSMLDWKSEKFKFELICLVWIIITFLYLGSQHYMGTRFILIIVPVLTLFGASFCYSVIAANNKTKYLWIGLLFAVIAYTFVYAISADLMFAHDSRYEAKDWIYKNIPRGSRIDVFTSTLEFLPAIDKDYEIVQYRNLTEIRHDKDEQSFAKFAGYYEDHGSKYIIIVNWDYGKFTYDEDKYLAGTFNTNNRLSYPLRTKFYEGMLDERGYIIIGKFRHKTILNPKLELVNPTIVILQKNEAINNNSNI